MESYASDAACVTPDETVVAQREAARLLVRNKALPIVDVKASDVSVWGGGRRAVLTCTVWTRFRHVFAGTERASEVRQAWTLEKGNDSWRVVRVVWDAR